MQLKRDVHFGCAYHMVNYDISLIKTLCVRAIMVLNFNVKVLKTV